MLPAKHTMRHSIVMGVATGLLCIAASTPSAVMAQVNGVHVTAFPWGGYANFAKNVNLDDEPLFGGTLGLNFHRHVGVEGHIGWIATHTQDGFTHYAVPLPPAPTERDLSLLHYGVDLIANL